MNNELMKLVLKNNFFEFNGEFFQQVRGTAIGTKCAPSYAILFLAALEQRLLDHHVEKPLLWWRYIDDIFLIWTHGEEKLLEFINFLNSAHHSIKFTAEYSKESVNLLDVKVIRKEDRIITDLTRNRQIHINFFTIPHATRIIRRGAYRMGKLSTFVGSVQRKPFLQTG